MIIMLSGRRKTGKTEAANVICQINTEIKVASFADFLREDYSTKFGVPAWELLDNDKKEEHRESLISYAALVRARDRFFFAKKLFSELPEGDWVIDDLRNVEELELGLRVGAVPYMVSAGPVTRKVRGWKYKPEVDEHYLETEMDLSAETYRKLGGGHLYNDTNKLIDLQNRCSVLLKELNLL